MKMAGVRVDANDTIAMGHVMRCISIAVQLKKRGYRVKFFISEEYAAGLIKENGFDVICLHNRYCEKEQETCQLLSILRSEEIELLLLDSYQATYPYMAFLRKHVRLIYIDDLNSFCYPADVVINYAPDADIGLYRDKRYRGTQFLLGSRFAPLRPDFCRAPIQVRELPERIFLATGGTDAYDMICGILEAMRKSSCKCFKKSVVTGKFYAYKNELKRICSMDASVEVYHDVSSVCEIMRQCDIAISAGGTTLAELCACGLPTVGFSMADNQLAGIRAYAREEALLYAGDVRDGREGVVDSIVRSVFLLSESFEKRRALAERAHQMVDGHGAGRIAKFLAESSF